MLIHPNQSLADVFTNIKHEIHRALHDKRHPFRYLCLASHDEKSVGVRYVVLRDLIDDMNIIVFTDWRTDKVRQSAAKRDVELLFYHPLKKLQLRVSGEVKIHHKDKFSNEYWKGQNGISARAYNAEIGPGKIIDKPEDAHLWPKDMSDKFFTVLKIIPRKMDVLQLNKSAHLRVGFEFKENAWEKYWMAP